MNINPFSWSWFQFSKQDGTIYEIGGSGIESATSTKSGAVVSSETALEIPVVWSAVNLIAGTLSTLPFKLYENIGNGKQEAKNSIIMKRPNKLMSMQSFIESALIWAVLEGNFYAVITRNSSGNIISIMPVSDQSVDVKIIDGDLIYVVKLEDGKQTLISQENMLHFKFFSSDGICGMPFVKYLSETLGNSQSARDYSSYHLANGGFTGGLVIYKQFLDEQQRKGVALRFKNIKQDGTKDVSKLTVLEGDPSFIPRNTNNKDSQFLESREFDATSIAGALRVPPHMVGLTSKSTSWGTGIEQQNIGFVTYCLRYYSKIIEDEFNYKVFKEQTCEFVFNGLLRGDSASRAAYYSSALGGSAGSGWMTQNEVRKLDNLPPADGGDELVKWSMQNAESTITD